MKTYFSIIRVTLFISLSLLYPDQEVIKIIQTGIEKGEKLVQTPNESHKDALKSFKEAVTALDLVTDEVRSKINSETTTMYRIAKQLAILRKSKKLGYEWRGIAIRLASHLELEVQEEFLKEFSLFKGAFLQDRNISTFPNALRSPRSALKVIIDYYDTLINAISKRSFQEKQLPEVKAFIQNTLLKNLIFNRENDYFNFLSTNQEYPRKITEEQYALFFEIAEDYLSKIMSRESSTDILLLIRISWILGSLKGTPTQQSDYRVKMAEMYIKASRRKDLAIAKRVDLFYTGIVVFRNERSRKHIIQAQDLQSFIELFKLTPKLLTDEPFQIHDKIEQYKRVARVIKENPDILQEEAKGIFPILYSTLFEIIESFPIKTFLATSIQDPALDTWHEYQENRLKGLLEAANQSNDYTACIEAYRKAFTYVAHYVGSKIQSQSYQQLLDSFKRVIKQDSTFQTSNLEILINLLEDRIKKFSPAEASMSQGMGIKGMYVCLADQVKKDNPSYNHYQGIANQYRESIDRFVGKIKNIENKSPTTPWSRKIKLIAMLLLGIVSCIGLLYYLYKKHNLNKVSQE